MPPPVNSSIIDVFANEPPNPEHYNSADRSAKSVYYQALLKKALMASNSTQKNDAEGDTSKNGKPPEAETQPFLLNGNPNAVPGKDSWRSQASKADSGYGEVQQERRDVVRELSFG